MTPVASWAVVGSVTALTWFWTSLALGSDGSGINTLNWESILSSSPLAIITAIIVRWLLTHTDAMRREFIDTIERKDKMFTDLSTDCHAKMDGLVREMMGLIKESNGREK